MSDPKSVRFRQDQVSVFNGNNCPLSAGFSVRNRRNLHSGCKSSFAYPPALDIDNISRSYEDET